MENSWRWSYKRITSGEKFENNSMGNPKKIAVKNVPPPIVLLYPWDFLKKFPIFLRRKKNSL